MQGREVFIVAAARTAVGSFLGMFKDVPAVRLGAMAIQAAVERAGVDPKLVEEVFMGYVLTGGVGQAPARQAALYAAAWTGRALHDRRQGLRLGPAGGHPRRQALMPLGDADVVVAGGMETMTNVPYVLREARTGYRMGNGEIVDGMVDDGLWDPYDELPHGRGRREVRARSTRFTREAQDEFATRRYRRAIAAPKEGLFDAEIVPVEIAQKKGDAAEGRRPTRSRARQRPTRCRRAQARLRRRTAPSPPATPRASTTARRRWCWPATRRSRSTTSRRSPASSATAARAQAPEWFTTAPVQAIEKALEQAGLEGRRRRPLGDQRGLRRA